MEPADALTTDTSSYCLAVKEELYVVYLPLGLQTTTLDLGASGKVFSIQWYDPKNGGELKTGSIRTIPAKGKQGLGFPPEGPEQDWVALIRAE